MARRPHSTSLPPPQAAFRQSVLSSFHAYPSAHSLQVVLSWQAAHLAGHCGRRGRSVQQRRRSVWLGTEHTVRPAPEKTRFPLLGALPSPSPHLLALLRRLGVVEGVHAEEAAGARRRIGIKIAHPRQRVPRHRLVLPSGRQARRAATVGDAHQVARSSSQLEQFSTWHFWHCPFTSPSPAVQEVQLPPEQSAQPAAHCRQAAAAAGSSVTCYPRGTAGRQHGTAATGRQAMQAQGRPRPRRLTGEHSFLAAS